jgi:hypothetical protein
MNPQILLLWLIQSQPQAGPASAETLKNDPQGLSRIFAENSAQLFLGLFGNFHRRVPFF